MPTPEELARKEIDALLTECGWLIQDYKKLDLSAGRGIAIREVRLKEGRCDYLLLTDRKPVGIIGASPGGIGTAVGQQHLKAILSFCNAPMMNEIEAYITFKEEDYAEDDTVTNESTREFLQTYMHTFDDFVRRVLTVLPQQG